MPESRVSVTSGASARPDQTTLSLAAKALSSRQNSIRLSRTSGWRSMSSPAGGKVPTAQSALPLRTASRICSVPTSDNCTAMPGEDA